MRPGRKQHKEQFEVPQNSAALLNRGRLIIKSIVLKVVFVVRALAL